VIAADAGQEARARAILGDLLETSPGFDPLFADLARDEVRSLGRP
jgi:hypothetical protein